jgi:hypothetical protein
MEAAVKGRVSEKRDKKNGDQEGMAENALPFDVKNRARPLQP